MSTHVHQPLNVRLAQPSLDTDRYHAPRRPRRVALGLVTVAVAVASFAGLAGSVGADGPVPTEVYVVRSGDTLWEIAAPVTAPGDDVRATIAEIVELNDLRGAGLSVGQELRVPIAP
jgi:nucleoid-associated protein YgaU